MGKFSLKNKKDVLIFISVLCAGLLVLGISKMKSENEEKSTYSAEDYRKDTEKRLEEIISGIDGASNVKVFVELDEYAETYSPFTTDGQNRPLPKIKGVAVVCDCGGNSYVKNEITRLVCAACSLRSTRVFVSGG